MDKTKGYSSPLRRIVYGLLICSEITAIYGFGGDWSISQYVNFILGLLVVVLVLSRKESFSFVPLGITILTIDLAIIEMITAGHMIPANSILIFLVYCVYWYFVTPDSVGDYIKTYKHLAVLLVGYAYIQYFVYLSSGYQFPKIIPGIPINGTFLEQDLGNQVSDRFSSLFSEASYLARFVVPLIILELFKKERINWLFLLFLIIPMIIAVSGTGVIALLTVAIFWVFEKIKNKSRAKYGFIIVTVLFGLLLFSYLKNTEIGALFVQRTAELSKDNVGDASVSLSGYIRIWYGFDIYSNYSLIDKFFGNQNPAVLASYVNNTLTSGFVDANQFFNGASRLLLFQGILGVFLFILFLRRIWQSSSQTGKAFILCFIVYMFDEAVYPGERMAAFLVVAYCLNKQTAERLRLL